MTSTVNRSSGVLTVVSTNADFVGLTHPDYPEYLKALVRTIAEATKKGSKGFLRGTVSAVKWIKKKLDEGAEMHNRHTTIVDERYANNWYHIRSVM